MIRHDDEEYSIIQSKTSHDGLDYYFINNSSNHCVTISDVKELLLTTSSCYVKETIVWNDWINDWMHEDWLDSNENWYTPFPHFLPQIQSWFMMFNHDNDDGSSWWNTTMITLIWNKAFEVIWKLISFFPHILMIIRIHSFRQSSFIKWRWCIDCWMIWFLGTMPQWTKCCEAWDTRVGWWQDQYYM